MVSAVLDIKRVSVDALGQQLSTSSVMGILSPDGTQLAYYSFTAFGGAPKLHLKNLESGNITVIASNVDGAGYPPSFSSDGQLLAFVRTNGVYVKNLTTGIETIVSTNEAGVARSGEYYAPSFSPDGTKVIFTGHPSGLVPNDTNGAADVFIKDLITGAITRISTDAQGNQGDIAGDESRPESLEGKFSPDGTQVIFKSYANDLVSDDMNEGVDLFIKDIATGAITRITNDDEYSDISGFAFSPDGKKVLFDTTTPLTPSDNSISTDIYLKDLTTGAYTLVSSNSAGVGSNGYSSFSSMSADGMMVLFKSNATNLIPGNTAPYGEIFLKNLLTGDLLQVSTNTQGQSPDDFVNPAYFSADGTKIIFSSKASNLVSNDTNGLVDLFISSIGENIEGTIGNNDLYGGVGYDLIHGGAGNDHIYGGEGSDRLYGDEGDDYIRYSSLDFVTDGGTGNDTLQINWSLTVDLAAALDQVSGGGITKGFENVNASAVSTRVQVIGNELVNRLIGGTGDDYLDGRAGDDLIQGGNGNDQLYGGEGIDQIYGNAGDDYILYSVQDTLIDGGEDRDTLQVNWGIKANLASKTDQVQGGGIALGFENINAAKATSKVTLLGNTDENILTGGAAADYLSGAGGHDTLTGNGGADQFIYAIGGGFDTITDFANGSDILHIVGFGISFSDLNINESSAGAVINYDGDDLLLLKGISISQLDQSDFIFI